MRLMLVVPCYNEQEVLGETVARLTALLDQMVAQHLVASDSGITFIDDGSTDATWQLIAEAHQRDQRIHGLKLSRNRGHQNALLAGLLSVPGDITVSIDADLQDDLEVIPKMVQAHKDGAEIVYGVRSKRDCDTWFKRTTARGYYRFLRMMGVDIVPDHADFRLLSRRALSELANFHEVNLYLRGIIPMLGFKTATIEYERKPRLAGESKYPLRKMLALAIDGITSLSSLPLQWITRLGILISIISVLLGLWAIIVRIIYDEAIVGWASTVVPIYFLGGLQLLALGIIGNYIAKIYTESKHRPRFIIEKTTDDS